LEITAAYYGDKVMMHKFISSLPAQQCAVALAA
jgi:hypothetical protein